MSELDTIVEDLEAYLTYEKERGVKWVPVPATADNAAALAAIAETVAGCTQCDLHRTRTRTVPGQGAAGPEIMFPAAS